MRSGARARRRPASSPRSGSSRATSAATRSARTSRRSRSAGELPRRGRGRPALPRPVVRADRAAAAATLAAAFHRAHEERYGFADRDRRARARRRPHRRGRARPGGSPSAARRQRASQGRRSSSSPGATLLGARPAGRAQTDGARDAGAETVNVELQVIGSALRVDRRGDGRGARPLRVLGEHQGAARLLDGALRRARADGRAGRAHPRPPRRDARRGRGRHRARGPQPGDVCDPQRPVRRRHAPARHHARLAHGARLRGHRARTTPTSAASSPASLPAGLARALRGGPRHPADAARPTRCSTSSSRQRAQPRRAARRPARAARGAPARRAARRRALRAPRAASASPRRWTSSTRTPSGCVRAAIAALPDGRCEADDVLEAVGRRPRRSAATVDDRTATQIRDRLRRHGAAARRQPQLPARGHALGLLLRRPLPRPTRTCPPPAAPSRR